MRRFDSQEIAWLECLVLVARIGPISAPAFLARLHFSRAAGRALILQPRGHFGYCYVRPAHLATAAAAQNERRSLMTLLLLLTWLRREGYVAVEYDEGDTPPPLLVVGEAFDAVRPERSRVVLNAEGDYSCEPHQVLSAHGQIAYEGLRLEGDAFMLAREWARGTLHASLALEELLALVRPAPQPAPASAPVEATHAKAPGGGSRTITAVARTMLRLNVVTWLTLLVCAAIAGIQLGGAVHLGKRTAGPDPTPVAAVHTAPVSMQRDLPVTHGSVTSIRAPAPAVAASTPIPALTPPPTSRVTPTATPAGPLYGLDVSKWNGNWLDHLKGALAGISFVFVRASDGLTADPAFDRHWTAVRSNGLVRGSYHFYRVDIDADQQAQFYLRMLGGASEQGDIAPALDFEAESFPPGASPPKEKVQADLLRALQALERQGGRVPMIYTNWDIGTNWLDDERFARYPLWIADWSQRSAPRLPATWAQQGFRFWQRTDHYLPPNGDRLAMDLDWFIGHHKDLTR